MRDFFCEACDSDDQKYSEDQEQKLQRFGLRQCSREQKSVGVYLMATHVPTLQVRNIVGALLRTGKAPAEHARSIGFMPKRNEIGEFSAPATANRISRPKPSAHKAPCGAACFKGAAPVSISHFSQPGAVVGRKPRPSYHAQDRHPNANRSTV